jgi:uncharacterized protein (DUF2267 family)
MPSAKGKGGNMQYLEIVSKVKGACQLDEKDSERAIRTVLETLGERLPDTERKHLADQLPKELKDPVSRRDYVSDFDLEQFYTRIASREGIRYAEAVDRARCVMNILQLAISEGEIKDIKIHLPEEYRELFGEPPDSALSPSAV